MKWEKCLFSAPIFCPISGRQEGPLFMDAEISGIWAVHKCVDRFTGNGTFWDFDCYTLTHLPTRLAAIYTMRASEAKEFAQKIKDLSWHLVKDGSVPRAGFEIRTFMELKNKYQIAI